MKKVASILLLVLMLLSTFLAAPFAFAEEVYLKPTSTYTCDFEGNYISGGLIADKNSPNPKCTRGEILKVNDNSFLNFYADNNSSNFHFEIFNSSLGDLTLNDGSIYTITVKYKVSNVAKSVVTQEKTVLQLVRYSGESEGVVINTLPNASFSSGETTDWLTTSLSFKADLSTNSSDNHLAIKLISPTCPTATTEKENLITTVYFDDIIVNEYPQSAKVITFDSCGGEGVNPLVAEEGASITLPTTTRNMYNFVGWYLNDAYTQESNVTSMPNGNIKLYAKWEPVSDAVVITFDSKGGEEIDAVAGKAGDKLILPTPVRDGFRFAGWIDESGNRWNQTTVFPSQNTKLTAKYEYKEIVLNFEDKEHYDSLDDGIFSFRYSIVNEQSNFGTYALKYDTEHGWNPGNFKGEAGAALFDTNGERIRLEAGATYKMSYYLKITNVADKTYRCYRDGKDTYGLITVVTSSDKGRWANWSDHDFYDKYTPNDVSNNWVKVTREFVAKAQGEDFNYLSLAISGYSVLYIDDLKLWKVDKDIEEKEGYSLTFETDGGNWIDTVYGNTNDPISLPTEDPVRDGYIFKGWYSDITLETPFNIEKFGDDNITAYAAWEKIPEKNTGTNSGNNANQLFGGNNGEGGSPLLLIIIIAAAVVVIGAIVVVIIIKSKKKKA